MGDNNADQQKEQELLEKQLNQFKNELKMVVMQEHPQINGNRWLSIILLCTAGLGNGALIAPFLFAHLGLIFGSLTFYGVYKLLDYSWCYMDDALDRRERELQQAEKSDKNSVKQPIKRIMLHQAFKNQTLCQVCLWVTRVFLFLCALTYFMYIQNSIIVDQKEFEQTGAPSAQMIFIIFVFPIFIQKVRTINYRDYLVDKDHYRLFGVCLCFLVLIYIIVSIYSIFKIFSHGPDMTFSLLPSFKSFNILEILSCICAMIFCFDINGIICEVRHVYMIQDDVYREGYEQEKEDKEKWERERQKDRQLSRANKLLQDEKNDKNLDEKVRKQKREAEEQLEKIRVERRNYFLEHYDSELEQFRSFKSVIRVYLFFSAILIAVIGILGYFAFGVNNTESIIFSLQQDGFKQASANILRFFLCFGLLSNIIIGMIPNRRHFRIYIEAKYPEYSDLSNFQQSMNRQKKVFFLTLFSVVYYFLAALPSIQLIGIVQVFNILGSTFSIALGFVFPYILDRQTKEKNDYQFSKKTGVLVIGIISSLLGIIVGIF